MLLDLHHDFADAKGDFVRKFGAIAMPKEQKPDTTAAAKEAVARVPDRPDLKTQEEFKVWEKAYIAQAANDFDAWAASYLKQFKGNITADRKQADKSMMTNIRKRSRTFLSQHPAFR